VRWGDNEGPLLEEARLEGGGVITRERCLKRLAWWGRGDN